MERMSQRHEEALCDHASCSRCLVLMLLICKGGKTQAAWERCDLWHSSALCLGFRSCSRSMIAATPSLAQNIHPDSGPSAYDAALLTETSARSFFNLLKFPRRLLLKFPATNVI